MPTYEYRCPAGHDFERFVLKISDAQGTLPCPSCGVEAARQLSAGGGLLFKGSGFYITDYGKDGKKDQRSAPSSAASTSATSPASPSATPAASTPAAPAPAAPAAPKSGSAE
ncbi:MAG: FmdB family zinc ribbon protein [Gemmatimonadota bacterium]